MSYDIYLDDVRQYDKTSDLDNTVVCRSYESFVALIMERGLPNRISFDYHLGDCGQKNGKDAAKWLVQYCINNRLQLPRVSVHSEHEKQWEIKEVLRNGVILLKDLHGS